MRPTAGCTPWPALRGRVGLGAALVAALTALPRAQAHPHNTVPPVDLTFTIRGNEVTALIDMEKWQIVTWGEKPQALVDLESPVPPEVALQRLPLRLEVAIDGRVVAPVLRRFDDPPVDPKTIAPHVKLAVAYPVATRPTSLRVRWKEFWGIIWETEAQIPLLIEADAQIDTAMLTKVESEFTWHARPPAAFRSAPPPTPEAPAAGRLPLGPLGLALLALALPFVGPLRRRSAPARWAPSGVALALGGALLATGLGRVETPWGRALPPTEAQARTVFTGLLANVYRSFDATSEGGIYDLLSASVERSLLDGLYADVYESLVLRDQGGAVARVEEVTPQEIAIAFPENGATTQFTADARWRLDAAVSHLGHTHRRKNEYRAEIVVRHDGGAWHIASVRMLERKRLDDGRGGLLITPKDIEAPTAPPPGSPSEKTATPTPEAVGTPPR